MVLKLMDSVKQKCDSLLPDSALTNPLVVIGIAFWFCGSMRELSLKIIK